MTVANVPTDKHPDLRALIADELNTLNVRWPPELQHEGKLTADDLEVLCRRTWTNIRTQNFKIDGGSFAVCVVRYKPPHPPLTAFVETVQPLGSDFWAISGMSFGQQPPASHALEDSW